MQEKGYRTVGEMLYLDEAFHTECLWNEKGYVLTPRNRPDDYKHTILRSMLVEEVHAILLHSGHLEMRRQLKNWKMRMWRS